MMIAVRTAPAPSACTARRTRLFGWNSLGSSSRAGADAVMSYSDEMVL
jgi:hypothetical protein